MNRKYKIFIDENIVEGRTDLIIRTADEPFPIICELKREKKTAYSAPNISEIQSQVAKYREFIADEIDRSDSVLKVQSQQDIRAYFICGKAAFEKLSPRNIQTLRDSKIEIKTYQDIIRQAERVYSDRVKLY